MSHVKFEHFAIGGVDSTTRSLQDRQQFHDPEGTADAMGFSSATWSLFGTVWPSGLILADIMSTYDIAGISIPSLIASARGAYHTASDHHPFTTRFLFENSRLNNLKPIRFQRCDGADTLPEGDCLI